MATDRPHRKGFTLTGSLVQKQIRSATEKRGFAESRLLTHWPEVVGAQLAGICRPVSVTFGRDGLGATLVLLTTGAQAPMLEMQKSRIRDRVNAVYGYGAIGRIRITQTAPTGFSEGQPQFEKPKPKPKEIDPALQQRAAQTTQSVQDNDLRLALEQLAANVYARNKASSKGQP